MSGESCKFRVLWSSCKKSSWKTQADSWTDKNLHHVGGVVYESMTYSLVKYHLLWVTKILSNHHGGYIPTDTPTSEKIKRLDVDDSPPAYFYINSDLDLWPWPLTLTSCDLWPHPFGLWPLNHINARNISKKKSCFSTWRPWPLTFTHDLDVVTVHHHTKFGEPTVNSSGDMIFFPVTFFLVNVKIMFFNIVTLTFDLWPWALDMT